MHLKCLDFACDSSFFTAPSASSLPTMHTTDVDKQVLFMLGEGYLIFFLPLSRSQSGYDHIVKQKGHGRKGSCGYSMF